MQQAQAHASEEQDDDLSDARHVVARKQLRSLFSTKFVGGAFASTSVVALAFWIDACGMDGFQDLALDPRGP